MASSPAILVTRPRQQAPALLSALRARGYTAHALALLDIRGIPDPAPQLDRTISELERYQHIIFISGNAVRFGMARISAQWRQFPPGICVYTIGDSTAELLRAYDIDPASPGAEMTSESLLAMPQLRHITGQRVLIIKGLGGRSTLREGLSERGARVDELSCYQRQCPALLPGELAQKLSHWEIGLILISSGEGLCNLLALLSPAETINLATVPLIVPSARISRMAEDAGFTTVYRAHNASDTAMLDMVEGTSLMAENNT